MTDAPWYVYILQSETTGFLYTGISNNPDRRLATHNAGRGAKFTKKGGPWVRIHLEGPYSHGDALRRERAVKKLTRAQRLALAAKSQPL